MRIPSKLLLAALSLSASLAANAKLNIFACEPEWKALASEIAPTANIFSATTAKQDPHNIEARPSLIAKMRKADLVICSGAELEGAWLPALQQRSGNPKIHSLQSGVFFAANHVDTIGKVAHANPTMGDIHPEGNPHLHLDPYRVDKLAKALAQRMSELDPENKKSYQTNVDIFSDRWLKQVKLWEEKARPLKNINAMTYHTNFDYLLQWLEINVTGDLEPKPGITPSVGHLKNLLEKTKKTPIDVIIYASYQDKSPAQWLNKRTNAPAIELPMSVGGNEKSNDLFSLYDSLINQLLRAVPNKL